MLTNLCVYNISRIDLSYFFIYLLLYDVKILLTDYNLFSFLKILHMQPGSLCLLLPQCDIINIHMASFWHVSYLDRHYYSHYYPSVLVQPVLHEYQFFHGLICIGPLQLLRANCFRSICQYIGRH